MYRLQWQHKVGHVPCGVFWLLAIGLCLQVASYQFSTPSQAMVKPLPKPLAVNTVALASLGERITAAKLLMLWLQTIDNRAGLSLPFASLDYTGLIAWLDLILTLDPKSHYPLLSASRLYTLVKDEHKIKQMLDFVEAKFLHDPNTRWRWMAHAVYVAKHRLGDLSLARHYAHLLRTHVAEQQLPYWAQQMEIYILEDMGEIKAAKILIGGLLDSGVLQDKHELKFLQQRLTRLEQID